MVLATFWIKSLINVTLNVIQAISMKKQKKSFRKRMFSVFSLYISMFWLKMKEKARNFLLQFIFFSQNCINYPLFSVFRSNNFLSKKDHLFFLVKKKGIYAISRTKFLFTGKVDFSMIFFLFHCFHKKINKKQWILRQYTFFSKNFINEVFFNVYRSINGILHKTPFYKYNICNLYKDKTFA